MAENKICSCSTVGNVPSIIEVVHTKMELRLIKVPVASLHKCQCWNVGRLCVPALEWPEVSWCSHDIRIQEDETCDACDMKANHEPHQWLAEVDCLLQNNLNIRAKDGTIGTHSHHSWCGLQRWTQQCESSACRSITQERHLSDDGLDCHGAQINLASLASKLWKVARQPALVLAWERQYFMVCSYQEYLLGGPPEGTTFFGRHVPSLCSWYLVHATSWWYRWICLSM